MERMLSACGLGAFNGNAASGKRISSSALPPRPELAGSDQSLNGKGDARPDARQRGYPRSSFCLKYLR
jgi:hypothetical protein